MVDTSHSSFYFNEISAANGCNIRIKAAILVKYMHCKMRFSCRIARHLKFQLHYEIKIKWLSSSLPIELKVIKKDNARFRKTRREKKKEPDQFWSICEPFDISVYVCELLVIIAQTKTRRMQIPFFMHCLYLQFFHSCIARKPQTKHF